MQSGDVALIDARVVWLAPLSRHATEMKKSFSLRDLL
jgi:hypothetical protein